MHKFLPSLRVAVIVALAACSFGCNTYYNLFGVKQDFYTPEQIVLHENVLKAIDFDYGFDMDTELDYVHPEYEGFDKFKADEKDFQKAVKSIPTEDLLPYYEKLYRLRFKYGLRMSRYERTGQWKYYTFIEKYLLPPLAHYTDLVEKEVIKRDKGYRDALDLRKEEMDNEIREEQYKKEFDDLWQYDYNS